MAMQSSENLYQDDNTQSGSSSMVKVPIVILKIPKIICDKMITYHINDIKGKSCSSIYDTRISLRSKFPENTLKNAKSTNKYEYETVSYMVVCKKDVVEGCNNQCYICKKIFVRKKNLSKHISMHLTKNLFKSDVEKSHQESSLIPYENNHVFFFDDLRYVKKINLPDYLKTLNEENPNKSLSNAKESAQSNDLFNAQESNLVKHAKQSFKRSKLFKCHVCEKKFIKKINYLNHLNIHVLNGPMFRSYA